MSLHMLLFYPLPQSESNKTVHSRSTKNYHTANQNLASKSPLHSQNSLHTVPADWFWHNTAISAWKVGLQSSPKLQNPVVKCSSPSAVTAKVIYQCKRLQNKPPVLPCNISFFQMIHIIVTHADILSKRLQGIVHPMQWWVSRRRSNNAASSSQQGRLLTFLPQQTSSKPISTPCSLLNAFLNRLL